MAESETETMTEIESEEFEREVEDLADAHDKKALRTILAEEFDEPTPTSWTARQIAERIIGRRHRTTADEADEAIPAFLQPASEELEESDADQEGSADDAPAGTDQADFEEPEPQSEEAMERATARIESHAEEFEPDPATLGTDLRDALLEIFKTRDKPWGSYVASQQREIGASIDFAVRVFMQKAVKAIASRGGDAIRAKLEKYTDKAGTISGTIQIVAADDGMILALHKASGKEVLIITADVEEFMGARPVETDDDEPGLGFEAGSDVEEGAEPEPDHPDDDSDLAGEASDEEE